MSFFASETLLERGMRREYRIVFFGTRAYLFDPPTLRSKIEFLDVSVLYVFKNGKRELYYPHLLTLFEDVDRFPHLLN